MNKIILTFLFINLFIFQAHSAERVTTDNFAQILEEILSKNPDIVLEVLRRNSEAVLDIAQQGSNLRRKHNLEIQWKNDMKTPKKVNLQNRPILGSKDAKVKIVGYSDFTCHYCQQASKTISSILHEFGKEVCFVFKHMPQDEKGISGLASIYYLAIAQQDEDKAWKFHDILFNDRDRLVSEGEEFLKKEAQKLGIDMKRLAKDSKSQKIRDIINEDLQEAQKLGAEGTPYFLVNNLIVRGALPLDLFREAINIALH